MFPRSVVFNESSKHFKCNGKTYPSSENLYQALKSDDENWQEDMTTVSPQKSKELSKFLSKSEFFTPSQRNDWEEVKIEAMELCVRLKFDQNEELWEKLKYEDSHIEERNCWGDTFWGTVDGFGENHLGKILMKYRKERLEREKSKQTI